MNFTAGIIMALVFYILILQLITNYFAIVVMAFIVGIMCAYQVIVFASLNDIVPASQYGIALSFVNMINMAAGSVFNYLIGKLLVKFWDGTTGEGGVEVYSETAYMNAMYILPLTLIIGSIGFILMKPKRGVC